MGQLDYIKSFEPINNTPVGATGNPLEYYKQMPTVTWSTPSHFSMSPVNGPFTPAGVYEVTGAKFLQDKMYWGAANTQIVSAPERPVDKGTYDALLQNSTGVYLQSQWVGVAHQYAGKAPTTGIYTGYYSNQSEELL